MDISSTIAPKSDQLNADDLIAGPRTIVITRVFGNQDAPEQPVSVAFEGDGGKPYKPCKSMRRVMVHAWGPDASSYVGRSMTLYRDPDVKFGGMAVGGIRISHMSHIDRDMTVSLTESKARRKPYTVRASGSDRATKDNRRAAETVVDSAARDAAISAANEAAALGTEHFRKWWNSDEGASARPHVRHMLDALKGAAEKADEATTPKNDEYHL